MVVLAPLLLAGAGAAAARRSKKVLAPRRDVAVLTAVTVIGFVALYVAGWTSRAHEGDVARLLPWAVVVLSVLWPEPNVLRYCLLLAGGTLLGATVLDGASPPRWVVGGALVATAVALVATNRLTAASAPRLGGTARTRGRGAGAARPRGARVRGRVARAARQASASGVAPRCSKRCRARSSKSRAAARSRRPARARRATPARCSVRARS